MVIEKFHLYKIHISFILSSFIILSINFLIYRVSRYHYKRIQKEIKQD